MNTWIVGKDFRKTSLPDEKAFYSKLHLEGITDEDYIDAQKVFKEFNIKHLCRYRDLYVQNDTLLFANVLEKFKNEYIEIYELDPACFLFATALAWQACLKKTRIELELLTYIDMLLMFENGISRGICHAIHRYAKPNNKYMKNYNKDMNHHISCF